MATNRTNSPTIPVNIHIMSSFDIDISFLDIILFNIFRPFGLKTKRNVLIKSEHVFTPRNHERCPRCGIKTNALMLRG